MSARVKVKPRRDVGMAVLMKAEGLCVLPWVVDGEASGWRAVYGVPAPEEEPDKPMPRVIGYGECPLVAAVVAMERTVLALREGRSGVCLSMGSDSGAKRPREEGGA